MMLVWAAMNMMKVIDIISRSTIIVIIYTANILSIIIAISIVTVLIITIITTMFMKMRVMVMKIMIMNMIMMIIIIMFVKTMPYIKSITIITKATAAAAITPEVITITTEAIIITAGTEIDTMFIIALIMMMNMNNMKRNQHTKSITTLHCPSTHDGLNIPNLFILIIITTTTVLSTSMTKMLIKIIVVVQVVVI